MNAPLSRYLTRFSAQPTADIVAVAMALPEPAPTTPMATPMTTLAVAELDQRLAAAREEARAAAAAAHAQAQAALAARHETALAEAVAAARAERTAAEAEALLVHVVAALAQLRETLADGIAKVLRPIVADAVRERALDALGAAVESLIADSSRPPIAVRAPEHLVAAIRARGVPAGLELGVADTAEASVAADATRIETRLAAALADLATTEG